MRQDKCKVIGHDVIKGNMHAVCEIISTKRKLFCPDTCTMYITVGDVLLVEYNEFNRGSLDIFGTIIAKEQQSSADMHDEWIKHSRFTTYTTPKQALDWLGTNLISINEEKEMNNHVVELMLENFYTVGINFKNSSKIYTYKVAKDIELEVEDLVIVETNSGMEIVTVQRVDEGMNIDLASDIKYKFIVQKIDLTKYQEMCDTDNNVASVLAQNAAQKQKEELLARYVTDLTDEQVKLLEDCGVSAVKRL